MISFLLAASSAHIVALYMLPSIRPDSDSGAEWPPEKELRPWTVLGDPAFLGIHVLWAFVLRVTVGDLLKRFLLLKGGIIFVILDGGALGFEFFYCFLVIPTLALRARKMSRIRYPPSALYTSFPCIYVSEYL
ncbi:unnamed protein product [Urochloa humidicola]